MTNDSKENLGEWRQYAAKLFMRSNGSDAGKLVLLRQVHQWLMDGPEGLPYKAAGERLLRRLEDTGVAALSSALFVAHRDDYAALITPETPFYERVSVAQQLAGENWSAPGFVGFVDTSTARPTYGDFIGYGVATVLRELRAHWCGGPPGAVSPSGSSMAGLGAIAISVTKAGELWGWGVASAVETLALAEPTTYAELVTFRNTEQGRNAEWTEHQLAILRTAVARATAAGERGARKRIAKDLGDITERRVGQLYRKEPGSREKQRMKNKASGRVINFR